MKILFVGVFSTPWSTNIPMAIELKKKGNEVTCFDYRIKLKKKKNFYYKIFLDIIKKKNLPFFKKIVRINRYYLFGSWKINRQLLQEVRNNKYDLVFLAKATIINYKTISKLNKYTKTWYYFMDPIHNAYRIEAYKYAALSTWSSSTFSSVNALFKRNGANSYFITQGCNIKIFKPFENGTQKLNDIIFVGSISPKRKEYIKILKKNMIDVICYGHGWKYNSVYLKELAEKYRGSKIILNFTRGNIGFSIRIFQAMGTNSFVISEYCRDLERFFKKGVHLEWFKTPEELSYLIKSYLKNETIRKKISNNGYKLILEKFTWEKVIEKLIQIIKKNSKSIN